MIWKLAFTNYRLLIIISRPCPKTPPAQWTVKQQGGKVEIGVLLLERSCGGASLTPLADLQLPGFRWHNSNPKHGGGCFLPRSYSDPALCHSGRVMGIGICQLSLRQECWPPSRLSLTAFYPVESGKTEAELNSTWKPFLDYPPGLFCSEMWVSLNIKPLSIQIERTVILFILCRLCLLIVLCYLDLNVDW